MGLAERRKRGRVYSDADSGEKFIVCKNESDKIKASSRLCITVGLMHASTSSEPLKTRAASQVPGQRHRQPRNQREQTQRGRRRQMPLPRTEVDARRAQRDTVARSRGCQTAFFFIMSKNRSVRARLNTHWCLQTPELKSVPAQFRQTGSQGSTYRSELRVPALQGSSA
jgi:hypothetical protein